MPTKSNQTEAHCTDDVAESKLGRLIHGHKELGRSNSF